MARDKTDLTPAETVATVATRAGDVEAPKLTGLLGGKLDLPDTVGLGLGASPEAKRLVLLGMMLERQMALEKQLAALRPKKGRPKSGVTIDMERAAAALGADELWRDKTGKGLPTQKAAIELAVQIDGILCETGAREKPLFGEADQMKRWQDSVSKGLRQLGREGERFSKN